MEKVIVTVRKENGSYWANTENIEGIVVAEGESFEKMKKNLNEAFEFHLEECEKDGDLEFVEKYKNGVEFVYEIEMVGICKQLPELNLSELARRLSINPAVMRKYATGKINASEQRLKEIQEGIHQIGREFTQISLL